MTVDPTVGLNVAPERKKTRRAGSGRVLGEPDQFNECTPVHWTSQSLSGRFMHNTSLHQERIEQNLIHLGWLNANLSGVLQKCSKSFCNSDRYRQTQVVFPVAQAAQVAHPLSYPRNLQIHSAGCEKSKWGFDVFRWTRSCGWRGPARGSPDPECSPRTAGFGVMSVFRGLDHRRAGTGGHRGRRGGKCPRHASLAVEYRQRADNR
jgi:hypothetical protein